eukprot:g1865.t1
MLTYVIVASVVSALVTLRRRNQRKKLNIFVIGATGSIGLPFIRYCLGKGHKVIAALHRRKLPDDVSRRCVSEFGVDVTNEKSLDRVFQRHKIDVVWNLAAPLSVESENNPERAKQITVGGMRLLLKVMRSHGVSTILFSDSIGSFGETSPRKHCKASWLVSNPTQNPGSEYGRQKRECRELMNAFVREDPSRRDARWIVIPGVLHSQATWGDGTTEYALEAIKCAVNGVTFSCPVPLDANLPMIYIDDLVVAMHELMCATKDQLREPTQGYTASGFSFTANMLFKELSTLCSDFKYEEPKSSDTPAGNFSRIWPDSISSKEMKRDIDFESKFGFTDTIRTIFRAAKLRS